MCCIFCTPLGIPLGIRTSNQTTLLLLFVVVVPKPKRNKHNTSAATLTRPLLPAAPSRFTDFTACTAAVADDDVDAIFNP